MKYGILLFSGILLISLGSTQQVFAGITFPSCSPPNCNDGNPCTIDSCSLGICRHFPDLNCIEPTLRCGIGTTENLALGVCLPNFNLLCDLGTTEVNGQCVPDVTQSQLDAAVTDLEDELDGVIQTLFEFLRAFGVI